MKLTSREKRFRQDVRRLLADYIATEGCSCCRDIDGHDAAARMLGAYLGIAKYADGSGYDFYKYKTVPHDQ